LYETHKISINESESLEAWYLSRAGGLGIVLLFPGYAESKESLLAAAVALHEADYDTLLIDFRGVGGSTGSDTALGVREAKDVAYSVAYAKRTWPNRPIGLYGVSMGAAAVLRAIAAEGVQPGAVILESPFDSLLGTVGNRFNAMGLPSSPGAELLVFWGSVQQGFNAFTHNPSEYARSVECPVLLLHGELDPRITVEQNALIFKQLAGQKQLASFPGAGHESLIVDAPQAWEEQVVPFLRDALASD
jgi:alpha-beta hydrolase superfamily lysophospholipase